MSVAGGRALPCGRRRVYAGGWEYGFAKRLGLRLAMVQNKDGAFVGPTSESGQEAITQTVAGETATMATRMLDPSGPKSYPLVTFSWLLLYGSYPDAGKSNAIKSFVDWSLTKGQSYATRLGYVPLPESVAADGRQALKAIK